MNMMILLNKPSLEKLFFKNIIVMKKYLFQVADFYGASSLIFGYGRRPPMFESYMVSWAWLCAEKKI